MSGLKSTLQTVINVARSKASKLGNARPKQSERISLMPFCRSIVGSSLRRCVLTVQPHIDHSHGVLDAQHSQPWDLCLLLQEWREFVLWWLKKTLKVCFFMFDWFCLSPPNGTALFFFIVPAVYPTLIFLVFVFSLLNARLGLHVVQVTSPFERQDLLHTPFQSFLPNHFQFSTPDPSSSLLNPFPIPVAPGVPCLPPATVVQPPASHGDNWDRAPTAIPCHPFYCCIVKHQKVDGCAE